MRFLFTFGLNHLQTVTLKTPVANIHNGNTGHSFFKLNDVNRDFWGEGLIHECVLGWLILQIILIHINC